MLLVLISSNLGISRGIHCICFIQWASNFSRHWATWTVVWSWATSELSGGTSARSVQQRVNIHYCCCFCTEDDEQLDINATAKNLIGLTIDATTGDMKCLAEILVQLIKKTALPDSIALALLLEANTSGANHAPQDQSARALASKMVGVNDKQDCCFYAMRVWKHSKRRVAWNRSGDNDNCWVFVAFRSRELCTCCHFVPTTGRSCCLSMLMLLCRFVCIIIFLQFHCSVLLHGFLDIVILHLS